MNSNRIVRSRESRAQDKIRERTKHHATESESNSGKERGHERFKTPSAYPFVGGRFEDGDVRG